MKNGWFTSVSCLLVVLTLAVAPRAKAVDGAKQFTSVDQAVSTAPLRELKKMDTNSLTASTIPVLNQFYRQNVVGHSAVIKCKAQQAAFTTASSTGLWIRGYKIMLKARSNSKDFMALPSFYFDPAGSPPHPNTIRDGMEITVSGTIRRCEFNQAPNAGRQLFFDLENCKLEK